MTDLKELLAVLDLPEDKQEKWLFKHQEDYGFKFYLYGRNFKDFSEPQLADLAFRLRDEAAVEYEDSFAEGFWLVFQHITGAKDKLLTSYWFQCVAQPIHWIIAALIAKEMAKGE